jgi:serine/threonine protein kinase
VDIWATGCILYEFSLGRKAFSNDYAVIDFQSSGTPLDIHLDQSFGTECGDFVKTNIELMLQINASSRPSAAELLDKFISWNQKYSSTLKVSHYATQNRPPFHPTELNEVTPDASIPSLQSNIPFEDPLT